MSNYHKEEETPLLKAESDYSTDPPGYTPYPHGQNSATPSAPPAAVPPIGEDELPPPYTPSTPGSAPSINCKICQAIVSLEGKQNQNVVKCNVCKEATPIKAAPPGKKYVRCPCNCLLICRATAVKIACPRPNCKRIITMAGANIPVITRTTVQLPNTNRIQCAYCNDVFLFAVTRTSLARCSNCRRVTAVNASIRTRCILYGVLGFVFLAAGTGVTVGTFEMAKSSGGIYTVWVGAFVIGILMLVRACYLGSVRRSLVLGPA